MENLRRHDGNPGYNLKNYADSLDYLSAHLDNAKDTGSRAIEIAHNAEIPV